MSKYVHKCLASSLGCGELLSTIGTPGRKNLHKNETITEKIEQNKKAVNDTISVPNRALPEILSI